MRTSVLWMSMAFLLLLSAGCRKKGEPDRVFDRKYLKVIRDAREEAYFYLVRNFVPGSSIALSIDGKLVWSEGMGQSSTDLEVPATRFTKYRMGEISQVLTSLAFYRMAEAGILDPKVDVRQYLPEFPEKNHPLTLQHLADHTSGIRQPTSEERYHRGSTRPLRKESDFSAGTPCCFLPEDTSFPQILD